MKTLNNKIDFAAIVSVKRANLNGDPLNGGRPREDYDGYGIFSDVAIKRKLRNRLQDAGEYIFVQMEGRENDVDFHTADDSAPKNYHSLYERAASDKGLQSEFKKGKDADRENFVRIACEKWIDVRAFGQLFAFKSEKKNEKKNEGETNVSVGVRGPVSIQQAVSVTPIDIIDMQITRSVNAEGGKSGKASDTMGTKHFINFGLYVIRGSINCQLAQKTGFSDEDAEKIKRALCTLFENDESSARPAGSCEVCRVYWWKHSCKEGQYPSAVVQRSLNIIPKNENVKSIEDVEISVDTLDGLSPEIVNLI